MLCDYDIVLIPFPFTNLTSIKIRPALIIAQNESDLIVVFISSVKNKKVGKYEIQIKPSKENNLKVDSIVKCSKIATLEKKISLGKIGCLCASDIKKVKVVLKNLLGL